MNVGPDIALIGSLLGDPVRANMLTALMGGASLTAGELARHGGVTAATASSHLAKLAAGGLVQARRQGRHSYYALSDADVGTVIESLMGLAARVGHVRTRTGPREPALREARVCYDHLAGEAGVAMLDALLRRGFLAEADGDLALTPAGDLFLAGLGIEPERLRHPRRPVCRACLDWSVRRAHLAGTLGATLLHRVYALGWAARVADTRIVAFTPAGRAAFRAAFAISDPV